MDIRKNITPPPRFLLFVCISRGGLSGKWFLSCCNSCKTLLCAGFWREKVDSTPRLRDVHSCACGRVCFSVFAHMLSALLPPSHLCPPCQILVSPTRILPSSSGKPFLIIWKSLWFETPQHFMSLFLAGFLVTCPPNHLLNEATYLHVLFPFEGCRLLVRRI